MSARWSMSRPCPVTWSWSWSRRLSEHGLFVTAAAGCGGIDEIPVLHPAVGPVVHFPGIRLRDDPLARPEPAHVGQVLQVRRHLPEPEALVPLGLQVDLLLGPQ